MVLAWKTSGGDWQTGDQIDMVHSRDSVIFHLDMGKNTER